MQAVHGRQKDGGNLDADRPTSKSAAAAAGTVFRDLARTTTFDGIRHLHRAKGRFMIDGTV